MPHDPLLARLLLLASAWALIVFGVAVGGTAWLVESRGWDRTDGLWFGVATFTAGIFVVLLAGLLTLVLELRRRSR